MYRRYLAWKHAKVRILVQWGKGYPPLPYHITLTPLFCISIPWPGGRLRISRYHGFQYIKWDGYRWAVAKQLFGRSKVKFEPQYKEIK